MSTPSPNNKKKNVLVIGAGPSGLAAVKELLEGGHEVMALEKAPDIGGVFRVAPDWSYEDLHLTISNFLMAFSDFAPLEDELKYTTKEQYFAYLQAYARHFNLYDKIQFNTMVKSATLRDDGTWHVVATQAGNQKQVEYFPDILIVATGSNHTPKHIDLESFTGEVCHSSDYRGPRPFQGKKVLVIGSGESSADLLHQLVHGGAASVTMWTRRYVVYAPRFLTIALDEMEPYDEAKVLHESKGSKVNEVLEQFTISRLSGWLPTFFHGSLRQILFWNVPGVYKDGQRPRGFLLGKWNKLSSKNHYFRADQSTVAVKNGLPTVLYGHDKISTVVAPKATFNGNKVTFFDVEWFDHQLDNLERERSIEVDTILTCTGFKTNLDWLHLPDGNNLEVDPRTWYKHCFPPTYGDKLMFLGWCRPHQGGIPPCSELQARFICMMLNGERKLPDNYADIAKVEGNLENEYYFNAQGYKTLVDFPAMTASLCDLIGCQPKCPPIWQFERFFQYWVYPSWPCWFRQRGPGANPAVLEETLNKVPLKTSWAPDPIFILSVPIATINLCVATIVSSIPGLSGWYTKSGATWGWIWIKPRAFILSGNNIPQPSWITQSVVLGAAAYGVQSLLLK